MAGRGPQWALGRVWRAVTIALGLLAGLGGAGGPAAASDQVVYADGLGTGWHNWSWGSYVNFSAPGAYAGTQAIGWQIASAWGGLYLHTDAAVASRGDTALQFAILANQWNQRLSVSVYGDNAQPVGYARLLAELGGDPPANSWKVYSVPLSALGAAGQRISGIVLQDATGAAQPTLRVDEVKLTSVDAPSGPAPGPSNCLGAPAAPEIRWENTPQNLTPGRPTDPARFYGDTRWRAYYDRIDGACTGTTEQILEWAARKWGFDQLGYPDLAKAMGVIETWWRQGFVGYSGEVGILQVHPAFWPDWEPAAWSTAYAADYAMAVVRSFYDGAGWLGDATRGNLRDAVAAWNCGCAYNGWGSYAYWVFHYNDTKPWERPGQPPEWF